MKEFLIGDWNNFKVNFSFFASALAVIIFITKATVQYGFSAKLEKLRKELTGEIEELKHKNEKIMFNFESYHSKKREMYPEFYHLIQEAIGQVFYLTEHKEVNDTTAYTEEELENHLNSLGTITIEKKKILSLHSRNTHEAFNAVSQIQTRYNYRQAKEKYTVVHNYHISKELFLSEDVSETAGEILNLLKKGVSNLNPKHQGNINLTKNNELKKQIMEKANELKQMMRDEFVVEI